MRWGEREGAASSVTLREVSDDSAYHQSMSTVDLRRKIKEAVDRVPAKRLESLAEFVEFLSRPAIKDRLSAAEKAISAGKGVNWRKVRSDV